MKLLDELSLQKQVKYIICNSSKFGEGVVGVGQFWSVYSASYSTEVTQFTRQFALLYSYIYG